LDNSLLRVEIGLVGSVLRRPTRPLPPVQDAEAAQDQFRGHQRTQHRDVAQAERTHFPSTLQRQLLHRGAQGAQPRVQAVRLLPGNYRRFVFHNHTAPQQALFEQAPAYNTTPGRPNSLWSFGSVVVVVVVVVGWWCCCCCWREWFVVVLCMCVNLHLFAGVICCRVERSKEEGAPPGTNVLYIMIIGVLPNYRGRGIGRQMLEKVLAVCAEDKAKVNPTKVYLHVRFAITASLPPPTLRPLSLPGFQGSNASCFCRCFSVSISLPSAVFFVSPQVQTNNEAAMTFYAKFGFAVGRKIEGYYQNIDPVSSARAAVCILVLLRCECAPAVPLARCVRTCMHACVRGDGRCPLGGSSCSPALARCLPVVSCRPYRPSPIAPYCIRRACMRAHSRRHTPTLIDDDDDNDHSRTATFWRRTCRRPSPLRERAARWRQRGRPCRRCQPQPSPASSVRSIAAYVVVLVDKKAGCR
jgi:ribosomal protein S18 acetylase RimI-like enzyme